MQQAPEPETLRSLLLQRSKLRSRKAPKLGALQQASSEAKKLRSLVHCSKQAPEPDKLRSLLRCSSKLSRSGACCCNAASRSWRRSGACCVVAISSHAPELATATQQALTLRSLLLQCSKFSRSGACCVATISSHAPELGAATQQAFTLRSLLLQRNKLRSRKAPKLIALQGLVATSSGAGDAPELAALQQQVLMLRSLLLQRSKFSHSGAWCCNAASSHALELAAATQQAGAGDAPKIAALQQQALTLRSLLRCRV